MLSVRLTKIHKKIDKNSFMILPISNFILFVAGQVSKYLALTQILFLRDFQALIFS